MVFSFFTNCAELGMWESVLLLSGFRILVNSLASWYVADPIEEIMGRSGTAGLYIFGNP